MAPSKVEYVLFDVDGLLINSENAYSTVISGILAPYGKDLTPDLKGYIMGRAPRDAALRILSFFPDISLTVDEYLHLYDTGLPTVLETVTFMPGAQKLVAHLRAHGVPVALATGSRRVNHTNKMKSEHIKDFFAYFVDKVICGDDLPPMNRKPEPDIFLRAAREKLGLNVGNCREPDSDSEKELRKKVLVFEDNVLGIQAAKRAGMPVVWVPDATVAKIDYSGAEQADLVINSLEDFVPEEWGFPPYDNASFMHIAP